MNIVEFYNTLGGDYEGVKSRLLTDARIIKFLRKFPAAKDFAELKNSLAVKDWASAFRYSHNLKGNCLNLGLSSLFTPSSNLCENLRSGSPVEDCEPMLAAVETEYQNTINAIAELTDA